MRTLTVTGVKSLTRSPDGQQVTINFFTKYVGDLAIAMPIECADELISALDDLKPVSAPDLPVVTTHAAAEPMPAGAELATPAAEPMPPAIELAPPPAEPMPSGAEPARPAAAPPQPGTPVDAKGPKELKVTVPKTWAVTADLQVHGVVLVLFDHQTEARAGYALGADAAKQIAVGLTKNAEAVLNSKAAKRGSRAESNSASGSTS